MSGFDQESAQYDAHFTLTCVGRAQREQVYSALVKDALFSGQKVLEINCGTGVDALEFHQRDNLIRATDLSEKMVQVARTRNPAGYFEVLDARNLSAIREQYSLVFSNFGGVNCFSPDEFSRFFEEAHAVIQDGGHLVLVVMGKRCSWDSFYFFLKGKWSKMGRRNTSNALEVPVGKEFVKTWYYSPKQVRQLAAAHFDVLHLKPIGLFVPPSFLAPFFERHRLLFGALKKMDAFCRFSFLSNFSDHYYLSLRKK
ncbi:MAG: hypothetical protein A3D92_15585 [Bacteroidetes bacterium RIFCSPHIGHO2_02_FULL_44_7]|nr:MAG: hypothetical protein A3D92_15585 [Bacteroidetes bacterium RIFCSPHIGHO2_02_FULL_44_7]